MDKERNLSPFMVIKDTLGDLNPGFSHTIVAPAWPRGDRGLSANEFYKSLLLEGERMGSIGRIDIGEGRSMRVFTTCAGSPHTPLRVPFTDFDRVYREKALEVGMNISEGPIISQSDDQGEPKIPEVVPLDMLIWTLLEDGDGSLIPVDLNNYMKPDIEASPEKQQIIDQHNLNLTDEKVIEIFENVHNRMGIARQTMLELFNTVVRREYAVSTPEGNLSIFPQRDSENISQGIAVGYYRGDKIKGLDQFDYDHLGMGPMSNAAAHFRVTCHIPMEMLNQALLKSQHVTVAELLHFLQHPHDSQSTVLNQMIEIIPTRPDLFSQNEKLRTQSGALRELVSRASPYELLKLIDPYSTIAHKVLNPWLEEQAKDIFADFGLVAPFQHHAGDYERELRSSEGIEVVVDPAKHPGVHKNRLKAQMYEKAVSLLNQRITPLWNNVIDYVSEKTILNKADRGKKLKQIQKAHSLPKSVLSIIEALKPTERQLTILAKRSDLSDNQRLQIQQALDRYTLDKTTYIDQYEKSANALESGDGSIEDLSTMLSSLLNLQLYDSDWNEGFNLPGAPSFSITHNRVNGNYHMWISWLLSKKGLSEGWLGGILSRAT